MRNEESSALAPARTVLQLEVSDHPGVMSHVVGLFARRGFNLDGILVLPRDTSAASRIWLLVRDEPRLPHLLKELARLEDVATVVRRDAEVALFTRIAETVA